MVLRKGWGRQAFGLLRKNLPGRCLVLRRVVAGPGARFRGVILWDTGCLVGRSQLLEKSLINSGGLVEQKEAVEPCKQGFKIDITPVSNARKGI